MAQRLGEHIQATDTCRAAMIEVCRTVKPMGPVYRGASMVVLALDAFAAAERPALLFLSRRERAEAGAARAMMAHLPMIITWRPHFKISDSADDVDPPEPWRLLTKTEHR